MKQKLFLCLLIFPALIFASEKFPHRCRISGLHYSHESILLFSQHTAKPRLYVFNNISAHPIWLTHERKNNRGVGAGWDSPLFPKHWSAILVTRRRFNFQCHFQNKAGRLFKIPCHRVIRACQFSEFYAKNPIGGGYWVVENVLFHALEPKIRARGFWLPKKIDA